MLIYNYKPYFKFNLQSKINAVDDQMFKHVDMWLKIKQKSKALGNISQKIIILPLLEMLQRGLV